MIKINHEIQVRVLQIATHLIAIPAIVWACLESRWDLLLMSAITYCVVFTLGLNVGIHRFVSHRQFKTYRPIEYVLVICGVLCTVGSPMSWAIVHQVHHRHTDDVHDPHSPHRIGKLRTWFGFGNSSGLKNNRKLAIIFGKDPLLRFTHRHYTPIILTWVILLLVIDPLYVLFIYCIPTVLAFHCSNGAIVVIPHYHGYKLFKTNDSSRNSWISNILTLGEGWHNTHHKYPNRWNTRHEWWEWDLPAQVIKLIKKPDIEKKVVDDFPRVNLYKPDGIF